MAGAPVGMFVDREGLRTVRCRQILVHAAAAVLAVTVLLTSNPAASQLVACVPPNLANTCTESTTTAPDIVRRIDLPGQVVVAGSGPAANYLTQVLTGPNGAVVQRALTGINVLTVGPSVLVGQQAQTLTATTRQLGFGPGTILIGPDQSQTFFIPAGMTNSNFNTAFLTVIDQFFQSSQSLSARGTSYLTGDLHTTFQTTLIDDGFRFMDSLLGRGRDGSVSLSSSGPMAFAPGSGSVSPFGDALAFATKAPRTPMTIQIVDGWRAWISGSLGRARFDGTATNFGFKSQTASGEAGIERVSGQWLYGAAFGVGNARVTQDTTGDRGTIDSFRGGIYASFQPGPWSFTTAVTAGLSDINARRLSLFPIAATSSYNATTVSAGFEAVRRYRFSLATFEPLAGLVYTSLRADSFRETGTTFLDLAGNRANIDVLKGYVGGRVYQTYLAANGWAWTPELRGRVLYDFLNDRRGYTARFIADPAATPIPITGIQPDRFAGVIGAALNTRITPNWRAFASYDAEIRDSDIAHLFKGGLRVNW